MARTVLVVSPHPDDESVGCGGTLRGHAVAGEAVDVVFLTSGEAGGHGRAPEETRRVREEEAHAAAAVLGVRSVEFWREPDGRLEVTEPLVERLAGELLRRAPDVVYVTHAEEAHADHAAAARLVRMALERTPDRRPEVRAFEVWTPLRRLSLVVDVTAHVDAKLAAIRAHRSQCEVLRFDEAAMGLARWRGEMFCWPKADGAATWAEVFGTLDA